MAVEFEGFSIREYVSKMRTVDVVKCWPFGGDDSEEEVKPKEEGAVVGLLPPITVPKFRWWSHELELLRSKDGDVVCGNSKISELQEEESEIVRNVSNLVSEKADAEKPEVSSASEDEKLDLVCPVCRVFTAATVNAVNAHLDSCLARAREERRRMIRAAAAAMKAKAKAKAKAPKKRSIVEIFAVAPQIEAVNLEDDEDEESVGEGEVDRAKVSSGSQVASSNKKSVKKNGKLKKEKFKKFKKKSKKNVSIAKKEKSHKVKLQTPINFPGMLNGSPCNKRFSKDVIDAVSICKKKPSLKYLSTQKKHKVVRNSRLIAKRQKPVLPVRGILKNHIKVISGKNSSIMCNIQDGSEANPCGIQQSERHVRFSDKDDILGPRKKHVPSIECPKLRSIFNSSSDAIAASSAKDQYMKSDRGLAYVEVNGSDEDDSISTEHGTEVQACN
ncbi:hypothetical protein L1049_024942 [Liquidambar formosana]|uniref:UBZ4-type domain-containing protein n=1 Tax=Liquidambar formosana TaxID=63359 RepID=A0AAP0X046_LIQFO